MSCPFLIGRQIKICGAFKATLVLSVEELDVTCLPATYHTCGLYQKRIQAGVKLPLNEYNKDHQPPTP